MKFERLHLRNFKPYEDVTLDLASGVSVIHGPNGAGKSTLLEACFFALYGAKALGVANLADVVTKGAAETEIELGFTHAGGEYRVRRRLRLTDDQARTAECTLNTPAGVVEGAIAVRDHVADLLRMDADAFVNCAYVRQGEVNKLIHASPADRQDMIDDLLQLGKLEDYRERASEARLGVRDVRSGQRERAQSLEAQIAEKEDKELYAALNDLETRRNEVEDEIDRYEDNREQARETLQSATDVLERYREKREELDDLDGAIEELQEAIAETERERDRLQDRIRDERDRLSARREERADVLGRTELTDADPATVEAVRAELEDRDATLRERIARLNLELQDRVGEADHLRERADELDDRADERRSMAEDLATTIEETETTLADQRETLAELDDDLAERRERFDEAPVAFGEASDHLATLREERREVSESVTATESDLENVRERIAEAEALIEAGKCPECGQPVDDSPHVDRVDEDRERAATLAATLSDLQEDLADVEERVSRAEALVEVEREVEHLEEKRSDIIDAIEETETSLAEHRDRLAELRSEAAELEETAAEQREAATSAQAAADDFRESIATLNQERSVLAERMDLVASIADLNDEIAHANDEIQTLQERRESKAELNDERRERLQERRERRDQLREEYDEERIATARSDKERAEEYLEEVEPTLADLREQRDDLIDRIGGIRNEIEELESLREKLATVNQRHQALDSLYDEAETLEGMYGDLRAELRQRNVETLERMLNETFDLVYENDSYARIELDGSYELTVYQKDGEPLDPEQLSGGERALFNLSLRTAIYRLLAEGIEGTAPLPPLILDEPTVFLDAGHVSRLVDLVDSMRDLGVEQIVVVTHDEELVGAADAVIRVEKNPSTNRSTARRADIEPALVE